MTNKLSQPIVTIIVTNYKKEAFLNKAVSSCFDQTYKNIEVVVVDDKSSGPAIAGHLSKFRGEKIRAFYSKKNYGHYACCNFAMDAIGNSYVTFLGADDWIAPNHISDLYSALRSGRGKAAVCTYNRVDISGKVLRRGSLCEASIFFKKEEFLRNIGYFHMVRCGADTEYRLRAEKVFGKTSIVKLKKTNYKAVSLPDSLTSSKATAFGSRVRQVYARDFLRNIKAKPSSELFFDYKYKQMPFSVDPINKVNDFDAKNFKEVRI